MENIGGTGSIWIKLLQCCVFYIIFLLLLLLFKAQKVLAHVSAAGKLTLGNAGGIPGGEKKSKWKKRSCQILSQATSNNAKSTNYTNCKAAFDSFDF